MNTDLSTVVELRTHENAFDLIDRYNHLNGYSVTDEELKAWIKKIISVGDPLGILNNNSIIAFLLLYCNNYDTLEAYICNVFVVPAHRGQHLSKRLVERAIQICQSRNFVVINLDVAQDNASALSIYSQCGFTITEKYMKGTEPFFRMSYFI